MPTMQLQFQTLQMSIPARLAWHKYNKKQKLLKMIRAQHEK